MIEDDRKLEITGINLLSKMKEDLGYTTTLKRLNLMNKLFLREREKSMFNPNFLSLIKSMDSFTVKSSTEGSNKLGVFIERRDFEKIRGEFKK